MPASWITALHEITDGQVVAIDGKTLRRSFDAASGKAAIHMVSAWATANHISLGQVVVDAKSNEITAIPKLLEMLEISGCLVTIDAMGCQTEIAQKIVDGGGGLRAGREGKPTDAAQGIEDVLRRSLGGRLRPHEGASLSRREEKGHGREETRYYFVCPVPDDLPDRSRWPELEGHRDCHQHTRRDGKECNEVRYYILSKYLSATPLCRGGARPLGDREPFALATRRDVSGRPMPHPQRSCGRELQHPPPHGTEPAEERDQRSRSASRTNASPPAGMKPIWKKSLSEHDLWCNRPAPTSGT